MKTKMTAGFLRISFVAVLFTVLSSVGQEPEGGGGYDAPYFQADFTQDLNSWTSALVNPALLYRVNQMHASMAFYRWGLDRGNMGYQDFGLFYPIRLNHTVGLTLLHARNNMNMAVAEQSPGSNDYVDMGSVSYQDLWVIGNYSYRLMPWLVLGANAKMRTQIQFGESAVSGVPGLDIGVYLNPVDHYRFGDLGISLSFLDVMPTQTPWKALESVTDASDKLITSSRARFGIRYSGLNDNLVTSFEMILDNALQFIHDNVNWLKSDMQRLKDNPPTGISSDLLSAPPIIPRWGFHAKYMFIPQIWFKGGWTNNNIPYLGFNYNIVYPLPEMINTFNVDYHFGYSFIEKSAGTLKDERGMVMMLRLAADVGKTREQKESRRLYNKLVVAPMDTYQEAMRLFYAGKYWEAVFAYGKLISMFPTFYLNDKAVYYMGESYRHLYMNETAREIFREALEEYTTSDMRAHYLYGLMSVDYREELYDDALRNHAFIINLYAESDIVGEADYLAGQIAFLRGNYDEAKTLLEKVKPSDPSYVYAQYTLGIVNFETDRMQAAVQNLLFVINDTASQASDVMIQNAASLKLGHLYFEAGDKLREAVEAYGRVPDNAAPYGDEALLGSAWAWIKAGQANMAQQRADKIITVHPESPLVPEAHLLRGYSLMLQKKFPEAVIALERCLASTEKKYVTESDVSARKVRLDEAGTEFAPAADRIKKNAARKPSSRTIEERPELYREYEKFAKENKEFFDVKILQKSHTRFFMQKEQIVDDATYALAKATNYVKSRGTTQTLERLRGEQEKLDDEIERLKRELEESGE
ncbi:MAG: tetratricopeptide repeat protein [Chitinispirillales bacterium]|jgi:tetratricopeptide (TPR) repeat protein|nr:tetratricopeptide repeat protein [Chitinispirillales bacterium]